MEVEKDGENEDFDDKLIVNICFLWFLDGLFMVLEFVDLFKVEFFFIGRDSD